LSLTETALPGTERTYELRLDVDNGKWYFSDNGLEWAETEPIPEWTGITGNYVQWTGEIYGRETDMPGTNSLRCTLNMCNYTCRYDSTWRSPNFLNSGCEVHTSDSTEWGVNPTSQESIEIWDKVPL
jgi:hypothetical protein